LAKRVGGICPWVGRTPATAGRRSKRSHRGVEPTRREPASPFPSALKVSPIAARRTMCHRLVPNDIRNSKRSSGRIRVEVFRAGLSSFWAALFGPLLAHLLPQRPPSATMRLRQVFELVRRAKARSSSAGQSHPPISSCSFERTSFAPLVHGRGTGVASQFVRWRTEQWDASPISTFEWVGAPFGLEHGKSGQHSSQPAWSLLLRTLPTRVSASRFSTRLLKLKRCGHSIRRRLNLTGKARRRRISVAAMLR
jgi:hypothetical protein